MGAVPYDLSSVMTDPRYKKLASLLVNYSTKLQKGDRVLLDMVDVPDEFVVELMRASRDAGATPLVEMRHTRVTREILDRHPPRFAILLGQHMNYGWEEDGPNPDYDPASDAGAHYFD